MAWGGVPPYQSQWTLSALGPMTATDFSAPLRSGSAAAVVLQQHDRLEGHRLRDGEVLRAVPRRRAILSLGVRDDLRRVEQPELERDAELPPQRLVEVRLRHQAFLQCGAQLLEGPVQVLVDPRLQRGDDGGLLIGEDLVVLPEVLHRAAVARDDLHAPLADQHVAKDGVEGHGRAVPGVVGGHHRVGPRVLERHAERHRVVLPEEPLVELGVRRHAPVLVRVREEVLQQRGSLPVLRVVPLDAAGERRRHHAVEERVLAVDLLGATPARVPREVGLRAPDHQHGEPGLAALRDVPRFGSLHAAGPADEVRVPARTHAGRLGKLGRRDGRHAPLRHAPLDETVDALGHPEARHAQPRHAGAEAPESLQLLVGGHERQQVRDALLGGKVGVPEGRRLRRRPRRTPRTARPLPWRGNAPSSEPRVSCAPPVVRPVVRRYRPARRVDGERRAQTSAFRQERSTCGRSRSLSGGFAIGPILSRTSGPGLVDCSAGLRREEAELGAGGCPRREAGGKWPRERMRT